MTVLALTAGAAAAAVIILAAIARLGRRHRARQQEQRMEAVIHRDRREYVNGVLYAFGDDADDIFPTADGQ